MLDPWIIEEIRRREEQQRREGEAQRIPLPLHHEQPPDVFKQEESIERGVVVVDL